MTTQSASAALAALQTKVSSAPAESFKMYESSRASVRLITPKGFRISFAGGKYITQNEEAIEYLDKCIKEGVAGITFAGDVTSDDLNPEAALRKKHFAEFLEMQKQLTDPNRDFGTTTAKAAISPASTETQPKA